MRHGQAGMLPKDSTPGDCFIYPDVAQPGLPAALIDAKSTNSENSLLTKTSAYRWEQGQGIGEEAGAAGTAEGRPHANKNAKRKTPADLAWFSMA